MNQANHTALIVIDVQNEMLDEANPVYNSAEVIRNLRSLLSKARSEGVPVIYVQHEEGPGGSLVPGSEAWEIYAEIGPEGGELIVPKTTPDAFHGTVLHEALRARGIKHVVLTGMQTEICVDTTCRRAFSLGYGVTLVTDAHSTWSLGELSAEQIIAHHNRALRWFAKMQDAKDVSF
ncbi:cysteine hydrolase family protein [Paenibacillus sacheonensis]|uniref:Isochorismatase family protein n=1 Tax=Paenibacillus sacheonensis TaxID=742054 RepID=A0A7X4YSY3_9BACL|nr:cysteine hydrolase family protein [Paenibacillus sacheonensis]MBM7567107.1 nicotinamidase-related amidase [Paenibacillus sacheonensis]NBC70964.1 isochorismatase family protein [Paenibacillus sacheonensis]